MPLDKIVHDEMKGDMTLTQRIAMHIPIYKGYREKNLRRDEDRAVRQELSRALQGTKMDLSDLEREMIGRTGLMLDVERIRTKVDRYDIDVKKAVNGYSAFHASVKIGEDDLNALVKWDAQILDGILYLREAASALMDKAVEEEANMKKELREFERNVDSMIEAYKQREAVMKGFSEEA